MTKYLVLGHGGYNPTQGPHPTEVLVPPDTKLFFFADAGSVLTIPFKQFGENKRGSDYEKVSAVWKQLEAQGKGKEGESELHFQSVTYNYQLFPDGLDEERESARSADWNGAELVMIESGTRWLCEDTKGECPTPELLTMPASDPRVLDPKVWKHKCKGILGEYGGNNNEIQWVACSSIMVSRPDLPPSVTGSTAGPGHSDPEEWTPTNVGLEVVDRYNNTAGQQLGNSPLGVLAGGGVVLMGERHRAGPQAWVNRQGNKEEGQVTFNKGGAFSKAKIVVTGFKDKTNRSNIETELGRLKPGVAVEFSDA
jgi:hypothetical protein